MNAPSVPAAARAYAQRGWRIVRVPNGRKGAVDREWHHRDYSSSDFAPTDNIAVVTGPLSGDLIDIDLDCAEALALAPIYLHQTGARFGRKSKPLSHWLYQSKDAGFEAFADPLATTKSTLLELRSRGLTGGEHLTLFPPSIAGERREWHGATIDPAVVDAAKLRRRCAYLAVACLVRRHVSPNASEHPAPDLPHLLYEADPDLGRVAFRWLGIEAPDAPKPRQKSRHDYSRAELDLEGVVLTIRNDLDWHSWNRVGMAIFAETHGSDFGFSLFDRLSAKSPKYDPHAVRERWHNYRRSPPSRLSVGTLVFLAQQAGWTGDRRHG